MWILSFNYTLKNGKSHDFIGWLNIFFLLFICMLFINCKQNIKNSKNALILGWWRKGEDRKTICCR